MDATRFLGTFFRLQSGLRALLAHKQRAAVRAAPVAPRAAAFAASPAPLIIPRSEPAPVMASVAPPQAAWDTAQADSDAVDEAPASFKKMRSIEEVRADLARLRESAKQRVAQAQGRRDISFAPTDFMELAKPEPRAPSKVDKDFEATAFIDFSGVNLRHGA